MRAWVFGIGSGLLLSLASLSVAQARPSFSPKSTSFTAKGQVSFRIETSNQPCTAHFVGTTDAAGFGQINGATFTGSDFCTAVTSATLPWPMNAETKKRATLHDVDLGTIYGFCGPANVTVYVAPTGRFSFAFLASFSGGGSCLIQGYVKTTPAITIVKP